MKSLLFSALICLTLSGCAQQTFSLNKNAPKVNPHVVTHDFFVSGIGQTKEIDAASVCGGAEKVVGTQVQQTFIDGLLGFATLGIYTPRDARVFCSR